MKSYISIRMISMGTILLSGCIDKKIEKEFVYPEDNIKPQVNPDGNYNIIFILNDQEHFMREYPMNQKGRLMVHEEYYLNWNKMVAQASTLSGWSS